MRLLAEVNCPSANCPKVYDRGDGTVVVQGYVTDAITPPAGEVAALLPAAVILEAADALRAAGEVQ